MLGAGGISDGRGIAAAFMLGAVGAWVGTRFLATPESNIPDYQKQALLRSTDRDTMVSRSATGKPARMLRAKWGELYERGHTGLRPDLAMSVQWFRRAAEAGSVEAQLAVATAHYLGRGALLDKTQAARWYRLAAQGGDAGAMYLYAAMVETGDGVATDLAEARYWYAAAARNGEAGAAEKARAIDDKLKAPAS